MAIQVVPAEEPSSHQDSASRPVGNSYGDGKEGKNSSKSDSQLAALATTALSLSKNVPEAEKDTGAWFFANIELGPADNKFKDMNSVISLDLKERQQQPPPPGFVPDSAESSAKTSVRLWAHIDKEKPRGNTMYSMRVTNLRIFDVSLP